MTEDNTAGGVQLPKGVRHVLERWEKPVTSEKSQAGSEAWATAPPSYATVDKDSSIRKDRHQASHQRRRHHRSASSSGSSSSDNDHGGRHRRRRESSSGASTPSSFDKHETKRRLKRAGKDIKRRVKRHLHDSSSSSSSSSSESSDGEHRTRHRGRRDLGSEGSNSHSVGRRETKRRVQGAAKDLKHRVKRHIRDSSTSSSSSSSSSSSDSDRGQGRGGHYGRRRGWKKLNWPFSGRK